MMAEKFQEEVSRKIRFAENGGRLLKPDFEELMITTGHSIKEVAGLIRRGLACLDVEYGPEIFAFLPYNPGVFFATEPIQSGAREEMISLVLGELVTKYPQVHLIRKVREEALSQIKTKRGGLGLITWLNIFDDGFVGTESLNNMINQGRMCLCKNGLFVFSFNENESSRREVLSTLAEMNFPDLSLQYTEASNVAGSVFLIGQKTG